MTSPQLQQTILDSLRTAADVTTPPRSAPAVWSSARLVEADFSAIEAVIMGWCMSAPRYIAMAKLGVHAYLAAHDLGRPADLTWPTDQLRAYLKAIKKSDDEVTATTYARSKRVVHGTAYGLTPFGMCRNYPKTFPTLKSAEALQRVYFAIAPEVPTFQSHVQHTAYIQHYLGGAAAYQYFPDETRLDHPRVVGHPYQYQHWLWSVVSYERLTLSQKLWREKRKMPVVEMGAGVWYGVKLGEDAKRATAFYPQSIARGVQTDTAERLFDPESPDADRCYIGDLYYGQTPLRAPIHDSFLMEVPTRMLDRLLERVAYAMQKPIDRLPCPLEWGMGPALSIDIDVKVGETWGAMAGVSVPGWETIQPGDVEVANDVPYSPAEEGDEEDVIELETTMGTDVRGAA